MSHHGLLTTVAYQLGSHKPVTFALEGAVSMAGQTVHWLKENLEFFEEDEKFGKKKYSQNYVCLWLKYITNNYYQLE